MARSEGFEPSTLRIAGRFPHIDQWLTISPYVAGTIHLLDRRHDVAAARDRILDAIKATGTYTTRTAAETKAAKVLLEEGAIKSMEPAGSRKTSAGKTFVLVTCR